MKYDFLLKVIDDIATMGFNTVLLEYQDEFPYKWDLKILSSPDAVTEEDVLNVKNVCKEKK